jgi:hypothetical protein
MSINAYFSVDIIIPLISIPFIDFLLCIIIDTKARWFQLHAAVNTIIVYIISNDIYLLYTDPLHNIRDVESKMECNFIIFLHIYHYFIFKNTVMDNFHHFIFIGCGGIPLFYYYNSNLTRLTSFAVCGLPGAIEYFTLTLVKHNKMKSLTQKQFNSYLYNYFRYPITIYGITIIYIAHTQNLTSETPSIVIYYIIFLVFMNGSFYNKLTIENAIYKQYIK